MKYQDFLITGNTPEIPKVYEYLKCLMTGEMLIWISNFSFRLSNDSRIHQKILRTRAYVMFIPPC